MCCQNRPRVSIGRSNPRVASAIDSGGSHSDAFRSSRLGGATNPDYYDSPYRVLSQLPPASGKVRQSACSRPERLAFVYARLKFFCFFSLFMLHYVINRPIILNGPSPTTAFTPFNVLPESSASINNRK